MVTEQITSQAFKLKGRLFTLTVLQIVDANEVNFAAQLQQMVNQAPNMFTMAPVVLDFSQCSLKLIDFAALKNHLKQKKLIAVGVQGLTEELSQQALLHDFAVFNASSNADKSINTGSTKKVNPPKDALISNNQTKVITSPVRSGQQVYAKGSDLIVTASVSRGAELLADGNIHVYGCLRGRALAGIQGDSQVRIFCQDLDAELVSIAGVYALNDKIKQQSAGAKQVYIHDDSIIIAPI